MEADMGNNDYSELSDETLWQLVHEAWPSSDETLSSETLAEYVDGVLSEPTAEECERTIASNPEQLETYVMLLRLREQDTEEQNVPSDTINFAVQHNLASESPAVEISTVATLQGATTNRLALYTTALAASILAVAFGASFFRGSDLENQLASARSELTHRKLEDAQRGVDLAQSDTGLKLWLGNPTEWYGSSSARTRGGGNLIPDGVAADLIASLAEIESESNLNDSQKLWLAELQIGAGEYQRAAATLRSIDTSDRNEQWTLATACLEIRRQEATDATAGLEEASSALTGLLDSENLGAKALFNLAALRLVEGGRLVEVDFPTARRKLDECTGYIDDFLQTDTAPSLKQSAEAMRQRAIALRTP